ncbi:uncharacterized protein [Coffea arabica]|uniref:MBD domain-containing protein n=1 Tax=Coffea arabica TaxID=13443 RepID=A0A6P6W5J3_COFAR|nr:uncharacterized protein LOC113729732 [Coffea arabica]
MVLLRPPKNQQASASASATDEEPQIPEGWRVVDHEKRNGEVVKCYTNVIGQKFFTMEDLMRYVAFAKRKQISIYEPGFHPAQLADTSSEDEWESSEDDSSSEEEEVDKRHELKAHTAPPAHSNPKEQALVAVSSKKLPSSSTQVSDHAVALDKKLDEGATSSKKGKGVAKSLTKPVPLRSSRRLRGFGPEIIPEKAQESDVVEDKQ